MKENFSSFTTAFKMIFTDPVNLVLAVIPAILGLAFYAMLMALLLNHVEEIKIFLQNFDYISNYAGIFSKILATLFVLLIIFFMSWSFVLLVGIIAAPFNSLLSSRIEDKLSGDILREDDQKEAFKKFKQNVRFSLSNEIKKVALLFLLAGIAFILGLIPLLYPLGLFLIALLLSAQFLDYSWSRHNLPLSNCLKEMGDNLVSYFISGMIFLALAAIPLLNVMLPAYGTSYFTVLWLKRQKKIGP